MQLFYFTLSEDDITTFTTLYTYILGEKCDTRFEIYVDKRTACKLNSGEDKLYDILILHLEGGKDIFITVTGTDNLT